MSNPPPSRRLNDEMAVKPSSPWKAVSTEHLAESVAYAKNRVLVLLKRMAVKS